MPTAVPINLVTVLCAAIANFVLGFLWYGPLFGKQWMKLMGITKQQVEKAKKKGMAKEMILQFLASLVMAFVLAHALTFASAYLDVTGASAGLQAGFWNWLGFIATVSLGCVLWEGKSWKLWFLNNAYSLVGLCMMGVILAVWQ